MPKKTTILIIVLLLFTAGLIYIAVRTEQQVPPEIIEETLTEEELTDLIPTINPQTQISFNPAVTRTFTSAFLPLSRRSGYTMMTSASPNPSAS